MAQLNIAKQEMIKQLDDYPELRFSIETMSDEDSHDSDVRFKNYLRSVNLFVDLNLKDHFPIRKHFKESLHLVKCTNVQGEAKFLKKLVISNSKTLNEIQLLMLFNHPHIIKPELAFIDEEEVYLQFPYFEQTLPLGLDPGQECFREANHALQDSSNSFTHSFQVCNPSRYQV
jgi:hypothetical protein